MASSTGHFLLFVSTMIYFFVSNFKSGKAYDYPQLGAAGVVANEFVPQATEEDGGDTEHEYYPHQPGEVGNTNAGPLFTKALECFNDKYIYSRCEEEYRLTQTGEIHVASEYTDEYCNGACLKETHLVLKCIDQVLKHFLFYNKATVEDIRETLESGCSYGPKRGNFNVAEHIQADEDIASKISTSVSFVFMVMIILWDALF